MRAPIGMSDQRRQHGLYSLRRRDKDRRDNPSVARSRTGARPAPTQTTNQPGQTQIKRQQLYFADKQTHTRRSQCIGKATLGSRPNRLPARRACASVSARRRTLATGKRPNMLGSREDSGKAAPSLCGDRASRRGVASGMRAGAAPNEWRLAYTSPGRRRSHNTKPDQSSICPGWLCSGSRQRDTARGTTYSRYNDPNPPLRCIRLRKRLASSLYLLVPDTPCSPGRSCTVRQ